MKKLALVFAILIQVKFAAIAQHDTPANLKMDTIVDHAARDFIKDHLWVGFSAGVIKDGKIYQYNYGSIKKDKNQKPTGQTLYEIGSITKTFGSLLLAHAVLEKKVKLDDDIRKYLRGNYPNLEYNGKPIQLLHLVNLTSRLPDNLPDKPEAFKNVSPDSMSFAIAKLHKGYTKANLLEDLYKAKLDTVPGLLPRHSNVAGQLLGIILENIYQKPYEELIKEYITGPLKMDHTFMTIPANKVQLLATGYNDKGMVMPYIPEDAQAAGGLHSSIADLTKYLKFQLDEKDPAVKMTHQPVWGDANVFALGLNWFINKTGDGKLTIHDDGTTLGFTTYFMLYPEMNFGAVLLANEYSQTSNNELGKIAEKIFNENYYSPAQIASDGFGFSSSINQLLVELTKREFDKAIETANELKKSSPDFQLAENEVNNWAYKLMGKGKKEQAFEIFKLNVSLYPESYNTYDSLGEAYENMGNKELAIKNFKRSLELNPQNTNGIEHLKHLE
ncbi:serine hydrolase [Mucilaginibacter sp.]|uniref:serine hydrolase n=1 Tax=Mucilaginibacter sp. TaxID=1882438 RepID=UPI0026378516|nr:serine hydrolase [Mucilaginibacter sp.]